MVMIYDGMMINDVWRLMMVRQWGIRGEEEEDGEEADDVADDEEERDSRGR